MIGQNENQIGDSCRGNLARVLEWSVEDQMVREITDNRPDGREFRQVDVEDYLFRPPERRL